MEKWKIYRLVLMIFGIIGIGLAVNAFSNPTTGNSAFVSCGLALFLILCGIEQWLRYKKTGKAVMYFSLSFLIGIVFVSQVLSL